MNKPKIEVSIKVDGEEQMFFVGNSINEVIQFMQEERDFERHLKLLKIHKKDSEKKIESDRKSGLFYFKNKIIKNKTIITKGDTVSIKYTITDVLNNNKETKEVKGEIIYLNHLENQTSAYQIGIIDFAQNIYLNIVLTTGSYQAAFINRPLESYIDMYELPLKKRQVAIKNNSYVPLIKNHREFNCDIVVSRSKLLLNEKKTMKKIKRKRHSINWDNSIAEKYMNYIKYDHEGPNDMRENRPEN